MWCFQTTCTRYCRRINLNKKDMIGVRTLICRNSKEKMEQIGKVNVNHQGSGPSEFRLLSGYSCNYWTRRMRATYVRILVHVLFLRNYSCSCKYTNAAQSLLKITRHLYPLRYDCINPLKACSRYCRRRAESGSSFFSSSRGLLLLFFFSI